MISTGEDDSDDEYNEGEKHVKRTATAASHPGPVDQCKQTQHQPSPCPAELIASTLTSSSSLLPLLSPTDESPSPLPSAGHDATQPSPGVVRQTVKPPHAVRGSVRGACGSEGSSVAVLIPDCARKNKGLYVSNSNQVSQHPVLDLPVKDSVHDQAGSSSLSTSGHLNSEPALPITYHPLTFGNTPAGGYRAHSVVGNIDNTTASLHLALPSNPPSSCPERLECSSLAQPPAPDASLQSSETLLSVHSSTATSCHRRPSQQPIPTAPPLVSPAVARKPPPRPDHATGTSAVGTIDWHARRVDTFASGTISDTSVDERTNTKYRGSGDIVVAIPPLEQPLPPPSPPPPPDNTGICHPPDASASWSDQATDAIVAYVYSRQLVNDAGRSDRCVNPKPSERSSNSPGPVFHLMSSSCDEGESQGLHATVTEHSSKSVEMHHNDEACLNGQVTSDGEKTSVVDFVGNFNTVFSGSNNGDFPPGIVSLTAVAVPSNQDPSDGYSDDPSEPSYKVCNRVSESETTFQCYASNGIISKGGDGSECSIVQRRTSPSSLSEPCSRNHDGTSTSSVLDDLRSCCGSDLLISDAALDGHPSASHRSPIHCSGQPSSCQQNRRDTPALLSTKSLGSEGSFCSACSSKELIACQPVSLITSTENSIDVCTESRQRAASQNCLNCGRSVLEIASPVAPTIGSFNLCDPHQRIFPSPAASVVNGSSVLLHSKSPVNTGQNFHNPLHYQHSITSGETLHHSATSPAAVQGDSREICLNVHCTSVSNCCKGKAANIREGSGDAPCLSDNRQAATDRYATPNRSDDSHSLLPISLPSIAMQRGGKRESNRALLASSAFGNSPLRVEPNEAISCDPPSYDTNRVNSQWSNQVPPVPQFVPPERLAEAASPCLDLNHDNPLPSRAMRSDRAVIASKPNLDFGDNTHVFGDEAAPASSLSPHHLDSVSITKGPPSTPNAVGEDDVVVMPAMATAVEGCDGAVECDSLLWGASSPATVGLVLLHSQSSQDSGIASVPLEECYPPPAVAAALPLPKTPACVALNSCSEDFLGSLEADLVPGSSATTTACPTTPPLPSLQKTINPPPHGDRVHEAANCIPDGLLQPDPEQSSVRSLGRRLHSTESPDEGVSSSQPCSATVSVPQLDKSRQLALLPPTLSPTIARYKVQPPHTHEKPDQVDSVPTFPHHQHSLRCDEVALDKPCGAFDSVIPAHRSALKVLELVPSAGEVSVSCLSDNTSTKLILEPSQSLTNNTSSISSEDRTSYPSNETEFDVNIETKASEQTDISLHHRAYPCTADASRGFMSNGDTGCSILSQDNIGDSSGTASGKAPSSRTNKIPPHTVAPKSVLESATCLKPVKLSIAEINYVETPANKRNKTEAIFLAKLDQFASHMAKELVQESVLLSSTHAWNIRCSGQCRREQCRQDYYQSLLLLNASLSDDPLAGQQDLYGSSPSSGVLKKAAYDKTTAKAASFYSSSSSSSYGRNSSSSVGSGGWPNSLTHHGARGGGDRRDSMTGGSGAGAGGSSGRTSAMVLALSSGGSPGLCWTPEMPDASEGSGKTEDDEAFLSPRDGDNGSGRASSGSKKVFGGGGGEGVVVESMISGASKRSPYQFQKTISTNTTSTNVDVSFGRLKQISSQPEKRIQSEDLTQSVSKELNHAMNYHTSTNIVVEPTMDCPSPSLPTSLLSSLPASLPPSRPSLSPPPLLSSSRVPGHQSRSSLSVSHDSLVCKTSTAYEASLDDSHLITAAFSHDALHFGGLGDSAAAAAAASVLTRNEAHSRKQPRGPVDSETQHLPAATEDHSPSLVPSNGCAQKREVIKDCDSNSDVFCPRADPMACSVGKELNSGGQKKKRRTKTRKRSSSNRQQQRSSKSSSHVSNQQTSTATEGKFYRKSRKHKTPDPSDVYSVPIDSIEDPGIVHPKAVIATQPRRHSHRKHRVTSSTITAGLPLLYSNNIISNSTADVVSNSFGVGGGTNGVNDASCPPSHTADVRVVIGGKPSSKENNNNKKKRFSSNKQSRAVTSSVELSSPSSRQSIVSNFGCGNNKSSVLSSPKHKAKHPDGKQSVASDPIHLATDDVQKLGQGLSDNEVHSDKVHQSYSNPSRVSRKERHEHHSRICRILPFTALKSCKRKDHSSESRDDVYVATTAQSRTAEKSTAGDQRKRGHSLFSNIRNSLLSLFSFGGGGSDRSLSKEHKLRLKSPPGGAEGLRSSISLDSDSQAIISTSGSETSDDCPAAAGPSAAMKSNEVTAVDLLNHSNYSAFTSAINVTSPRSAVIGAAGADASDGGRDRSFNGGSGINRLVLSPEEQNCNGGDALNKETLQRVNNSEAVRAALLVPPPLPPANDPTTNSNNPLHTVPFVSLSSAVTTSSAPLMASSAVGCRSPAPVITNRALPPLPSAQPVSTVTNKAITSSIMSSAGVVISTTCAASPTPPPIPPPLPQSLLSAVGPPLPPPLPATYRHSVVASLAAKASAASVEESRKSVGGSAANNKAHAAQAEGAGVFLVHGNAAPGQEAVTAVERKEEEGCHFATVIEKVKDYGWYWGPISGKAAEKIISNEPDGSFIVRDSSDDRYIFSLTFKLNGYTRHVRIEHGQGNFSFGGYTKFKSQTIVEFIESAVEHSRSGRYLFFLHRRPALGPMRVQLLHPVSRHRHIQSLQHLCRFVIVKNVRRDLLQHLPLPVRLREYLTSPHYYSEQVDQCMAEEEEEQERALEKAAMAAVATGHEDNSQGHEVNRRALEEAAALGHEDQSRALEEPDQNENSMQRQRNNPLLDMLQEIEPNMLLDEAVNGLESNHESASSTNAAQGSIELCGNAILKAAPVSGSKRESPGKGDIHLDDSVQLGASDTSQNLKCSQASHQRRKRIDCKSPKTRGRDGRNTETADQSTSSCRRGVRSATSAEAAESPTLACHAVFEALNCLDESITQAEASIVAQAKWPPPNDDLCVQSNPHPSNPSILPDNKCISHVPNPTSDSQLISRVVSIVSGINPPKTVHLNKPTCDSSDAATRSVCSKPSFPSTSAVPAVAASTKPPLSLSSYLHATPGKHIHKYKPGKIVSYQVDLASDSPTVIKLTKLVDQRNFDELNGFCGADKSASVSKGELGKNGNAVPVTSCKYDDADPRANVQSQNEHVNNTLHPSSRTELKENLCKHLHDCGCVDSTVIGLVDMETAFEGNKVNVTTSNSSSEDNQNTASHSHNGQLSVLEDSCAQIKGGAVVEDEYLMPSRTAVTSSGSDVNNYVEEETQGAGHADSNKNSIASGHDSCSVVVTSLASCQPTSLQRSFINPTSSLPSVILNASLEELGSF